MGDTNEAKKKNVAPSACINGTIPLPDKQNEKSLLLPLIVMQKDEMKVIFHLIFPMKKAKNPL
ncbi:hypothetical protein WD019_00875 [Fictibacillus sp. Mic-4]|uniref:hypothetical protein n=1 Tax=Fictibacillus TaxID=1329200 RepID=UPI0012B52E17|nr:hypothetical protein [Fictibacillus gelatini]